MLLEFQLLSAICKLVPRIHIVNSKESERKRELERRRKNKEDRGKGGGDRDRGRFVSKSWFLSMKDRGSL